MADGKRKAWEIASDLFETAEPVIRKKEEETWEDNIEVSRQYDESLSLDWGSNVPGSGAPEKIMVAAVQALENRGYKVSDKGYEYLEKGLAAFDDKDFAALHQYSALLRRELAGAVKDESSEYWSYHYYHDFSEYERSVTFPEASWFDVSSPDFENKIRLGWLAQLIGGAMGTMVEGYSSRKLSDAFGEVHDYLREPDTYNDDTTYELAFLDAFAKKGYEVTSEDIALSWVGYIPCGWSAEEIAIRNIKNGIMPPDSGLVRNPFNEWIGAQMRGGILGMAAPGDPLRAAELAWKDGSVSHANNGVLGEAFVSVMTSLAFVTYDVKEIVKTAAEMIPKDSEYRSVIEFALASCRRNDSWRDALSECEEKYRKYNWIHAYPNCCCLIIALYYGESDFSRTLDIITMCGLDADCNAGVIMPVIAISNGRDIPEKYMHPAFEKLTTYMRGSYSCVTMDELVDMTVSAVKNAYKKDHYRDAHLCFDDARFDRVRRKGSEGSGAHRRRMECMGIQC